MKALQKKEQVKKVVLICTALFILPCFVAGLRELISKRDVLEIYWETSDIDNIKASDIIVKNLESETPYEMVMWSEFSEQQVENQNLQRAENIKVIVAVGDMELLMGKNIFLKNSKEKYCWISEGAAQKLFGNADILGKSVIYQENTYNILGVVADETEEFVLIQSSESTDICFKRFLVRRKDAAVSIDVIKEELTMQFGIQGNLIDYNLMIEIFLCILLAPVCVIAYFWFPWIEKKSLKLFGLFFLVVGIICLKIVISYAVDLVPTAWGNFEEVGKLYGGKLESLVTFLNMPKQSVERSFCATIISTVSFYLMLMVIVIYLTKEKTVQQRIQFPG